MNYEITNVRNSWEIREPSGSYKVELLERTFEFSVMILSQLNNFPNSKEADVIRYQIAKSSTSVGANYEEAQGASSKRDFYNKIKIVYRELRETNYWLRIIDRMEWIDKNSITPVFNESTELLKIFGKIRQTLRFQVEK